jgi:plasmid stabilization system protein ParE
LKVSFNPAALAELNEAVAFYDERTRGLGRAFAGEVRSTLRGIIEHPEAGFEVRPRVRRRLLVRFPYSILYTAVDERLRVLAVMHHSRDPADWEARL